MGLREGSPLQFGSTLWEDSKPHISAQYRRDLSAVQRYVVYSVQCTMYIPTYLASVEGRDNHSQTTEA